MRKNILFNTTRQWNVGDQIIMLGLLRLLRHLDFNIFTFNRHPNIWGKGKDNSYRPSDHTLENIDYYFAAGTPDWIDRKLTPLYDELIKRKIPHSFIGVGCSGSDALDTFPQLRKLVETSDLVTSRDQSAHDTLKKYGGLMFPCPGFFCGDLPTEIRTKPKTVGLIFMSDRTPPNTISPKLKAEMITAYREVIKHHKSIIICHYIDEAFEARSYFENCDIYYSHDAKDFPSFYSICDIVIGPRLHGILLASGMGIPSFIIGGYRENDARRRIEGSNFLDMPSIRINSTGSLEDSLKHINIKDESSRLIALRYTHEAVYLDLLCKKIPFLFGQSILKDGVENTVTMLLKSRSKLNEK